jgi:aryl-alcohol dehydrogenase-like predicted oxidoreductase
MRSLGLDQLALVLAHNENDLLDPAVIDMLESALTAGQIGGFGASVYSAETAARLIATVPIAALQLPASVLDWRFEEAHIFVRAKARSIALFVRSVFLQGALTADPSLLPAHLSPLVDAVRKVQRIAKNAGYSLPEFLIPPIRDIPGVTSLVIGVENRNQLSDAILASTAASLPKGVLEQVREAAQSLPSEFCDPSQWKRLAHRHTRG